MKQVSAIIPSYNEAGRISGVLTALRQVPEIQEILVVDDASTDTTCVEVLAAREIDGRIRLMEMPRNSGKGQAVLAGTRTIHSPLVLLLDADLVALGPEHVRALMRPVVRSRADMTLGLFRGGRILTDIGHLGTPWLTGQRCLNIELLRWLTDETASGYGLEIALTLVAQLHDYRVERVPLRGVWHPSSEFHRGFPRAIAWRRRMYAQIWRAWIRNQGPRALQVYLVRRLRDLWHDPLAAWRAARKRVMRLKE